MKRRFLAVATTVALAGTAWPYVAYGKGKSVPVKEPAADADADGSDNSADNGDEGASETKPTPAKAAKAAKGEGEAEAKSSSPNNLTNNPAAAQAGDHVAMPPSMEGKGTTTANENHTVVKGDTLWDLSQHYLGNPWYWPKVWSYNPQIANPHWIYPGDNVKFFPGQGGDEEAPSQVKPAGGNEGDGSMQAPEEVGEGEGQPEEEEESGDMVKVVGKIGFDKSSRSNFHKDSFVTDRELEESGQIVKSFAEKELLDNYDHVYMRFKSSGDLKAGDRFFVFSTVRDIKHPLTGAHYGYLTHIAGTVRIADVSNGVVTGVVDETWDEIYRGFYLAPFSEKVYREVAPKAGGPKVKGIILESYELMGNMGVNQVAFIDKGRKDGVEEGMMLDVVRRSDGVIAADKSPGQAGYEDSNLPAEVVGKLEVVDVKEGASTCLITKSAREFQPGDVVITSGDANPTVSER